METHGKNKGLYLGGFVSPDALRDAEAKPPKEPKAPRAPRAQRADKPANKEAAVPENMEGGCEGCG